VSSNELLIRCFCCDGRGFHNKAFGICKNDSDTIQVDCDECCGRGFLPGHVETQVETCVECDELLVNCKCGLHHAI
jgi:hypothetical protein